MPCSQPARAMERMGGSDGLCGSDIHHLFNQCPGSWMRVVRNLCLIGDVARHLGACRVPYIWLRMRMRLRLPRRHIIPRGVEERPGGRQRGQYAWCVAATYCKVAAATVASACTQQYLFSKPGCAAAWLVGWFAGYEAIARTCFL